MSEETENNNQSNICIDKMANAEITPVEETSQKIPDDIIESYKKEIRTDDYFDTNINLESITKSEFNLLEIKKELTDIKQKEILLQYVIRPFDNIEEEITEEKNKKMKNIPKTMVKLTKNKKRRNNFRRCNNASTNI